MLTSGMPEANEKMSLPSRRLWWPTVPSEPPTRNEPPRAAQSASIFGGENLPWNTKKPASRGKNVMTDEQMWQKAGAVRGGIKKAGAKIDVTKVKKTGWVMPWDAKN